MWSLVMTDRNGVEIDYCPEQLGLTKNFDKIIERSSQAVSSSNRTIIFDRRTTLRPKNLTWNQKRKRASPSERLI
jgi:Zn-finger nucleic acid-binding protein